ncbi:MAG: cupin domain-containing protein [Myxococcota bacterium]|nr:cupin domain-containing protein [Myxococcota bacterium]
MKIRRVVTGHSPEGKAVFASDERVDPIVLEKLHGNEFHRLWGGDRVSVFPDDGAPPECPRYFPPVGGFRFALFTVPPDATELPPGSNPEVVAQEVEAKLPGLAEHMEPDAPGMHTTDTIDFEYVISGRAVLELDDGATVELGPGDTVVQNGTRHAWRNPYSEPCRMVVFLVGAERKG